MNLLYGANERLASLLFTLYRAGQVAIRLCSAFVFMFGRTLSEMIKSIWL